MTYGYFLKSHSRKPVKLFFLDTKTLHPEVSQASNPITSQGAFGLGRSARFSLSVSHLLLRQVSCHVIYVIPGILTCEVCDVGYQPLRRCDRTLDKNHIYVTMQMQYIMSVCENEGISVKRLSVSRLIHSDGD